jgi:mercuric ion transport protein
VRTPNKLLRAGLIGTIIVALCCFTPILVVLLGVVGLASLTGYLDYVLLPALAFFVGLTAYALWRQRKQNSCNENPSNKGSL